MFLSFAVGRKFVLVRKAICCLITLTFVMSLPGPASAQIASLLPVPGTAVTISPVFIAPTLKGLNIHPENPFLFDFIVGRGDDKIQGPALKAESEKLVKFFLTAMTIPDKEAWVNLSPYEDNRIIPEALGKTEMGKVMLEQDYLLKQLASSLTNPETDLGKKFWTNVRAQVQEQFGTTDIPMSTFNKVWIVPAKAEVAEKDGKVFITQNRLKVMLEEDLDAMQKTLAKSSVIANEVKQSVSNLSSPKASIGDPLTNNGFPLKDYGNDSKDKIAGSPAAPQNDILKISSQVFRTTILPSIEKEINEGKNFAAVRQIYDAAILAVWYKSALKESLLGKIYADKSKVKGIETDAVGFKQDVYNQYVQAFKKGAYNMIKEDFDMNTAESVPTRYFSGGVVLPNVVQKGANGVAASAVNANDADVMVQMGEVNGQDSRTIANKVAAKSAASAVDSIPGQKKSTEIAVIESGSTRSPASGKLFDESLAKQFNYSYQGPRDLTSYQERAIEKIVQIVIEYSNKGEKTDADERMGRIVLAFLQWSQRLRNSADDIDKYFTDVDSYLHLAEKSAGVVFTENENAVIKEISRIVKIASVNDYEQMRKMLFALNLPLYDIMQIAEKLSGKFSYQDIFSFIMMQTVAASKEATLDRVRKRGNQLAHRGLRSMAVTYNLSDNDWEIWDHQFMLLVGTEILKDHNLYELIPGYPLGSVSLNVQKYDAFAVVYDREMLTVVTKEYDFYRGKITEETQALPEVLQEKYPQAELEAMVLAKLPLEDQDNYQYISTLKQELENAIKQGYQRDPSDPLQLNMMKYYDATFKAGEMIAGRAAASAVTAGEIIKLNSADALLAAIKNGTVAKDTRVREIKFVVDGAVQVYKLDNSKIDAISREFEPFVFGEATDEEKSVQNMLLDSEVIEFVSSEEVRLKHDLSDSNIETIKKFARNHSEGILNKLQQAQSNKTVRSISLTGISQEIPIENIVEITFVSSSAVKAEIINDYQVKITLRHGESVTVFMPGSREVRSISPMHVKGLDLFVAILSGEDDYRIMILDQAGQKVDTVGQADEEVIAAIEFALKSIKSKRQQQRFVQEILTRTPKYAFPKGEENAVAVAERMVKHLKQNASSSSLVEINIEGNYPLVYDLGLIINGQKNWKAVELTPEFKRAIRPFITGKDNEFFKRALEGTPFSQTAEGQRLLYVQGEMAALGSEPAEQYLSPAQILFSKNRDVIFDALQKYAIGLEQARIVGVRKGLSAFEILSQEKGEFISAESWEAIKPFLASEDYGLLSAAVDVLRNDNNTARRQVGVDLEEMLTDIYNGRLSRIEQEAKDFFFDNRAEIYRAVAIAGLSGNSLIVQSFDDWLADYALRKGENLTVLQEQLKTNQGKNKKNVALRLHWARLQNYKIANRLEILTTDKTVPQEILANAQQINTQTAVVLAGARAAFVEFNGLILSNQRMNLNGLVATLQVDVLEFNNRVEDIPLSDSQDEESELSRIQKQINTILEDLIAADIEDAEDARVVEIQSLLNNGYVLLNIIERTGNDYEASAVEDREVKLTTAEEEPEHESNIAASSAADVGGINFDPTLMNLQVKRDKNGVPLPVFQQDLPNINIEGLYPVIINIAPATMANFPLLSKAEEAEQKKAAFKDQLSPADRQKAIREEDILAQKS